RCVEYRYGIGRAGVRHNSRACALAAIQDIAVCVMHAAFIDDPSKRWKRDGLRQAVQYGTMNGFNHQQLRGRIIQNMLKLSATKRGVYRHRDRSEPCTAKVNFQKLGTIVADDRDP